MIFRCLIAAALFAVANPALAIPTDVVVRVISQGAKFIGSGMGGAAVVIRDAETGAILAEGVTSGGTGNTTSIMQASGRDPQRADAGAAAFRASIDIAAPRLVDVSVHGPLAQPQVLAAASVRRWLVPGAPPIADGWVLELPGLVVDIAEPATPARPAKDSKAVHVAAHVAMLCGCPIEAGGLWDAARFDVRALVERDGKAQPATVLTYAGTTGNFAGDLPIAGKGSYLVTVIATDRQTGAVGLDRASVEAP